MKVLISSMEVDKMYTCPMLVTSIEECVAKTGSSYCKVTMTDGVSKVTANYFQINRAAIEHLINKVCLMTIGVNMFNGNKTFKITNVTEAPDEKVEDFVKSAPIKSEVMYDYIVTRLTECSTPLKEIALTLYRKNRENLLSWSAAKTVHHAEYGGLLYHTYRMVQACLAMSEIYTSLNADLLVVGAALHDIGKLKELTTELGAADYTNNGVLLGHTILGILMVQAEYQANPSAYDPEEYRLLMHMIASHHGKNEYGAPVTPSTPEAVCLHLIDMLDSRIEIVEETLEGLQPGEHAPSNRFLDGAYVYSTVQEKPAGDSSDEALPY